MDDPQTYSDDQLLTALESFVLEERQRMPWFLTCLGEGDRRNAFVNRGYASTFDYCVRRLRLSEDEACRRIQAARAGVSRPEILSAMTGGGLSLTAVSRIAPHIRRQDAPEIISRAAGKTIRELDALLAPLSPESAKRDRIRTIALASTGPEPPTVSERVEFSFQGPPALRQAIERVKEILSNKYPFGDLSEVLLEIVGFYLEHHDPQQALALGRIAPVKGRSSIPASVRRAVWARDGGRCTFTAADGLRCLSRRTLELDHRQPQSLGGQDTVDNLRLLCRPHNDAERRRLLGEGYLSPDPSRDGSGDNLDFFRQ
jgi:hypothetical protein